MPQNTPQTAKSFAEEIAAIVAPPKDNTQSLRSEFLEVWRQFAEGLAMTGVGAEIRPSEDGRRYHLVLWPRYRPGWRSFLLSFHLTPDGVDILLRERLRLDSRDALERWLREFAQSQHFQNSLLALREQQVEPVEAILEVEGSPEVVVEVSAEQQRQLHDAASPDLTVTVELAAGESIPEPARVRNLRSAGLDFRVSHAVTRGRALQLDLTR